MKCDELKQVEYPIEWGLYYDKDEVDAAIAELKAENERLKKQSSCTFSDDSLRVRQLKRKIADNSEKILELQKALDVALSEVYSLLDKIESLKASHYAESVDMGMENRKLQDELTKLKTQMPEYKQFIEDEDFKKKLVDEYAGYVYEWAGHRYVATPYINVFIKGILRTLYKALANWAKSERYTEATWHGDEHREELWAEVQNKCLKKAEEYK